MARRPSALSATGRVFAAPPHASISPSGKGNNQRRMPRPPERSRRSTDGSCGRIAISRRPNASPRYMDALLARYPDLSELDDDAIEAARGLTGR